MKITFEQRTVLSAFTLTEMMVTGSLGILLLAGVLMGHLVGVRMFQYTKAKLGGTDDARSAITKLVDEVRSCKLVKVGTGNATTFTECSINSTQSGNAIQIYYTTATNTWTRYFLNSDNTLCKMTNGSTAKLVLANFITNQTVFTAEDHKGVVLTNNENNRVIGLTLQFYQIQYPIIKIGTNQMYDFYQITTKITRRTLE